MLFKKKIKENRYPIYHQILDSLDSDGNLSYSFDIQRKSTHGIQYVAGGEDGIFSSYMSIKEDEETIQSMIKELKRYRRKQDLNRMELFLKDNKILSILDYLLDRINEEPKLFNASEVRSIANDFMKNSVEIELVKLGIAMMGIIELDVRSEDVETIVTLGKYESLSLYSIVAVSRIQNGGNDIVFDFAKSLHGWGKINAVDRLKVTSDEIQEWIVCYGCSNEVMNEYLALTCANKGNIISYLRREQLNKEQISGIGNILYSMLDETAADGISCYDFREEAIILWKEHVLQSEICLMNLYYLIEIDKYAVKCNICDQDQRIIDLLNQPNTEKLVKQSIDPNKRIEIFYAMSIAKMLGIDVKEEIYHLIMEEPILYNQYLSQVVNDRNIEELILRFEETIPFEELIQSNDNVLGIGVNFKYYMCLGTIMNELVEYPYLGKKIISTSLRTSVIRNKTQACKVIDAWVQAEGLSLEEMDKELHGIIDSNYKVENDQKLKGIYVNLLNKNRN